MRTFICLGTGRLKPAGLLAAHCAQQILAAAALALVSDHAPAGTCTHMLSHATPLSEEKGAVMICIFPTPSHIGQEPSAIWALRACQPCMLTERSLHIPCLQEIF